MPKPSYQTRDPKGWGGDPKRGAALGRVPLHLPREERKPYDGKLYLHRVRLNSGGYDVNGTYFGTGDPLYWCADADGRIDFVLRARSRGDAKEAVRETYPKARFFR
jgi:hypothetical protein